MGAIVFPVEIRQVVFHAYKVVFCESATLATAWYQLGTWNIGKTAAPVGRPGQGVLTNRPPKSANGKALAPPWTVRVRQGKPYSKPLPHGRQVQKNGSKWSIGARIKPRMAIPLSANREIAYTVQAHQLGVVQIAAIENRCSLECLFDQIQIGAAKLFPFGHDHQRIGAFQGTHCRV